MLMVLWVVIQFLALLQPLVVAMEEQAMAVELWLGAMVVQVVEPVTMVTALLGQLLEVLHRQQGKEMPVVQGTQPLTLVVAVEVRVLLDQAVLAVQELAV
jgi:hypothetical protein